MSNGESLTPALAFDDLTGEELVEISQALGRPVEEALREGSLMVSFALEWQARKRAGQEGYTFKDALQLKLTDVAHHVTAEADPT